MTTREMLRVMSCEDLLACVARKLRGYAEVAEDAATATELRMDAEVIETKLRMVRGEDVQQAIWRA